MAARHAPLPAPPGEELRGNNSDFAGNSSGADLGGASSGVHVASPKHRLKGYVGFANLPNQVHKRSIKKGFDFTLLVAGEDGLGKATLVNSLFDKDIVPLQDSERNTIDNAKSPISIHNTSITEANITLRLNVLMTRGLGTAINNEGEWNQLVDVIESRFNEYLDQETITSRRIYTDRRIHACLYLVQPTGHCVKPLDLEMLKRINEKVNLIVAIAKADTMTEEEIKSFKQRIMQDLNAHRIKTFMPEIDESDDPETISEKTKIISRLPFAIVGSSEKLDTGNNRTLRARQYPWGIVEVENEEHSDFPYLRQLLIKSHMEELKDLTISGFYEKHRSQKMALTGYDQNHPENAPFLYFADEKKAHDLKMQKMEAEMRTVFEQKVHEKEAKLKAAEEELYAQHREQIGKLEKQRAELEERKRRMEGRPGTPERKRRGLRW